MAEHTPQQGHKLYYSTDGASYTEVTDLTSIEPPPMERDGSDSTTLSLTREITTPGTLTKVTKFKFKTYAHKTQFAAIVTFFTSKTNPLYWRITHPLLSGEATNGKAEFQGWVCKVNRGNIEKGNDKFMAEFEVETTTDPTETAGS